MQCSSALKSDFVALLEEKWKRNRMKTELIRTESFPRSFRTYFRIPASFSVRTASRMDNQNKISLNVPISSLNTRLRGINK